VLWFEHGVNALVPNRRRRQITSVHSSSDVRCCAVRGCISMEMTDRSCDAPSDTRSGVRSSISGVWQLKTHVTVGICHRQMDPAPEHRPPDAEDLRASVARAGPGNRASDISENRAGNPRPVLSCTASMRKWVSGNSLFDCLRKCRVGEDLLHIVEIVQRLEQSQCRLGVAARDLHRRLWQPLDLRLFD
jgi:hypothetical protein